VSFEYLQSKGATWWKRKQNY